MNVFSWKKTGLPKALSFSVLVLLLVEPSLSDSNAGWVVEENNASLAGVYTLFDFGKGDRAARFTVLFDPEMQCQPNTSTTIFASTATAVDKSMRQEQMESKMRIWVDGNLVWQDKIAVTRYANALEVQGLATNDLLAALTSGEKVIVKPLPDFPRIVFPLSGATQAIEQAKLNCLEAL